MAPKAKVLSRSRQPSKEEQEREEPSSEEEENEEEGSESHSSEEEKEDFSGDTGEDEDGDLNKVKSNPDPKLNSKSVNQENGSDSDSDLGSPSNYKLQPISRDSRRSSSKRTHQEGDGKSQRSERNTKKSRTEEVKSFGSSPSTPGGCITRLWSDDDEVTLLNGMVDFKNANGLDPNADMGAFYNFIKGKLRVDFTRDQLKTKIRRMKKRFSNALKKGQNGEDPVFSKPHEDKAFELSKKIWGGSVGNGEGSKKGENAKKDVVNVENVELDEQEIVKKEKDGEEEESDFWSKYPFLSGSFDNLKSNIPSLGMSESGMSFAMQRLGSIGNGKAKELDEKWKQLIADEVELSHKKLTLMKEQMKMVFDQ